MNMPGWLQATLTSFETSEKPFMEVAISGAINSAVAKQGEIADEDRPVIHAEWSAFQFMTRSDTEGVWGTHFAPMMIATTTEGKQIRSPDIADLNVETVKHWQERARAVQDPVMRARYAEAFMKLSKDASPMLAVAWLQPVIERYEQEGLRQEAEQLQLLASRKAKDVESDMKTVSVPYEIKKEEIDSFLNSITADSLDASLHRLAAYFIPKVANARDLLERMRRDTPLLSLISITRFDADGCPVGRIGSIDDDPDGRLHQQLWQSMSIQGPFLVWAIDRLREKYAPTVDDLLTFLRQSPLFGVSKDAILREGIDAYWASDFIKAIHVLVPQVERILRDLLALLGIPPVKTVRRHPGILDAKNMNDALEDERVRAALTEDLWRYLYILYVDRRGGLNLRNDLAHGLAKEETFNRIIADRVIHSLLALSFLRTTEKEGEPNS